MALLTKEERKTLNAEERKALRKKRRAEKPKKGFRININWSALKSEAVDLMRDLIGDDIPGPVKMDECLETLSDRADEWCDWPDSMGALAVLLEAVDGPIIRAIFGAILRPTVQKWYEEMKQADDA